MIKGLGTCYSAAYMSQTRDQQRFTISEVAADWDEQMVPQRIMWPSIALANGQLTDAVLFDQFRRDLKTHLFE